MGAPGSVEACVQQAEAYFKRHQIRSLLTTLLVELGRAQPADPISFLQGLLVAQASTKVAATTEKSQAPVTISAECSAEQEALPEAQSTVEQDTAEHQRAMTNYERLGELKKSTTALGKPVEAVMRARRQHSQTDAENSVGSESRVRDEESLRDQAFNGVQDLLSSIDASVVSDRTRSCMEEVLEQGRCTFDGKGRFREYTLLLQRCTQSIFADQKKLLQRIKELKKSIAKSSAPTSAQASPTAASPQQQLQQRWFELELLLRSPVSSAEDWERLCAAAKDAEQFLVQLDHVAKELGVLKGVLSRHLLPFDSNTDIHDQSNRRPLSPRSAAIMQETGLSAISQMEDGKLEERMIKQAVALRQLVRVKLADDADVAQAQSAISQLAAFCNDLESFANLNGQTAYNALVTLAN